MTSTAFKAGTRRTKRAARLAAKRPAFSAPAQPQWLTVAEAAEAMAYSQTTVRARIKSGAWQSRKDGNRTLVLLPT